MRCVHVSGEGGNNTTGPLSPNRGHTQKAGISFSHIASTPEKGVKDGASVATHNSMWLVMLLILFGTQCMRLCFN